MPFSDDSNRQFVLDFVREKNIKSVLDVGAGSGTYSDLLREYVDVMHGIEIWQPYVEEFDLKSKYSELAVDDVRRLFKTYKLHHFYFKGVKLYDLIIFGDVIEHMTEADAQEVWEFAKELGEWTLLSSPIVHYPQGEEHGNPHERHLQEDLSPESIRRIYGPFETEEIYEVTGTFIARGI